MSTTRWDEVVEAIVAAVQANLDEGWPLSSAIEITLRPFLAEVRSVLEDAQAEVDVLGTDLREIDEGRRRWPTALPNPDTTHRIAALLAKLPEDT